MSRLVCYWNWCWR